MKPSLFRAIIFSFIAFSLLFFIIYKPLAYRADHGEAVLIATQAQLDAQESILRLEPQIVATQRALMLRRAALRAKCRPSCTVVQTRTAELAALRAIARDGHVALNVRTFGADGSFSSETIGSLGGSLRELDGFAKLPIPIQLTGLSLTATGNKVKMEVSGSAVVGGT